MNENTTDGRDYVGHVCTLDGRAATISGSLNDFATVGILGANSLGVEFAWSTVARIMQNGGEFKS